MCYLQCVLYEDMMMDMNRRKFFSAAAAASVVAYNAGKYANETVVLESATPFKRINPIAVAKGKFNRADVVGRHVLGMDNNMTRRKFLGTWSRVTLSAIYLNQGVFSTLGKVSSRVLRGLYGSV